jgi:hypothetical protein
MYEGNMFDRHEATDNPMVVNISNKSVNFDIPLCCDTLTAVGVEYGVPNIVGRVVMVKMKYNVLVDEVAIKYNEGLISIKGKLIMA